MINGDKSRITDSHSIMNQGNRLPKLNIGKGNMFI